VLRPLVLTFQGDISAHNEARSTKHDRLTSPRKPRKFI
jgi:hypothetical protein